MAHLSSPWIHYASSLVATPCCPVHQASEESGARGRRSGAEWGGWMWACLAFFKRSEATRNSIAIPELLIFPNPLTQLMWIVIWPIWPQSDSLSSKIGHQEFTSASRVFIHLHANFHEYVKWLRFMFTWLLQEFDPCHLMISHPLRLPAARWREPKKRSRSVPVGSSGARESRNGNGYGNRVSVCVTSKQM